MVSKAPLLFEEFYTSKWRALPSSSSCWTGIEKGWLGLGTLGLICATLPLPVASFSRADSAIHANLPFAWCEIKLSLGVRQTQVESVSHWTQDFIGL